MIGRGLWSRRGLTQWLRSKEGRVGLVESEGGRGSRQYNVLQMLLMKYY
jgi:hypothetical protein